MFKFKTGSIWKIDTSLGPVSFHILKDFTIPRRIWLIHPSNNGGNGDKGGIENKGDKGEIGEIGNKGEIGDKGEIGEECSVEVENLERINELYGWDSLYIKYCVDIDKVFLEIELSTDYRKHYGYPEYLMTPIRIPN